MQGFIVEDGLGEEETPENPIRRFSFSRQVFGPIRTGYADPDFDEACDDYNEGIDFNIRSEANGEWNSYTSSGFKRKSRSLSVEERAAVDTYGLGNLKDFRLKEPTSMELASIFEMFEASLTGEFYDPKRWGHLPWRPRGVDAANASTPAATTVKTPVAATPAATQEAIATPAEPVSGQSDAQLQANAILEKIRQKK